MSLSAERIEIANRSIQQTFAQSSIAWQSIPHWDTRDPAQARVRSDLAFALADAITAAGGGAPVWVPGGAPFGGASIALVPQTVSFQITLAQATAAAPDSLLAAVIARTVELARKVDAAVIPALAAQAAAAATAAGAGGVPWYIDLAAAAAAAGVPPMLRPLIDGRALLEDSGFRAPSCLIASTDSFADFNTWVGSNVATEGLLVAANANSLLRSTSLNPVAAAGGSPALPGRMVMIGRRQEIAHGCAATASPGEEPVDLAVSVPPGLEVVGEDAAGQIELAVRTSLVARIKDERGVVVFHT